MDPAPPSKHACSVSSTPVLSVLDRESVPTTHLTVRGITWISGEDGTYRTMVPSAAELTGAASQVTT